MRSPTQTKTTPKPSFTSVQIGLLQRQCACGNSASLTRKCSECENKRLTLQRRSTNQTEPSEVPPIVHEVLREPGQPLDTNTRTFMESRFGNDFSQVRVHTDAKAAASAQAVNALAYTVGRDVVFGAEQYAPRTSEGRKLLAHELTHVVQQSAHITASPKGGLRIAPIDSQTEVEANAVAQQLVSNAPISKSFSNQARVIQCQSPQSSCSNAARQNCTDEDLLTAVCIGEAGNINDQDGKKGVMNVLMNRVADGAFAANIRAVATTPGQFDGLENGINLLNNPKFADCRSLAQQVIALPSDDPTRGAIYFNQSCEKPCEQYCTVYLGDGKSRAHYFARRATLLEKTSCQNRRNNPSGVNRYCCNNPRQKVYIAPLIKTDPSARTEEKGTEELT